jgi:hypothetical protein
MEHVESYELISRDRESEGSIYLVDLKSQGACVSCFMRDISLSSHSSCSAWLSVCLSSERVKERTSRVSWRYLGVNNEQHCASSPGTSHNVHMSYCLPWHMG